MPLTAEQIAKACGCRIERANKWHLPLNDAMAEYGITTPARQAAFLAQVAHESARLGVLEENLNYSAEGLVKVFPRHFPTLKAAALYARQPEKIASKVYANRLGNGDEESGEGWLYRGRGLIQITGADNYRACGTALGLDLIASPEKLTIPRQRNHVVKAGETGCGRRGGAAPGRFRLLLRRPAGQTWSTSASARPM